MIDLEKYVYQNWTWNPWLAFKRWMGTADVEALKRELEVAKDQYANIFELCQIAQKRADRYKAVLSDINLQTEMILNNGETP